LRIGGAGPRILQAGILYLSLGEWLGLAKVTLIFAVLLVVLGLMGYFGTGAQHPTALIPTWFGLALGLFGFLAISPSETRRKLFMHINVTIGLLGFLGAGVEAMRGYARARSAGIAPDQIALASKLSMTALLLIYVILCVRSFIAARRARRV
jgi:hypothetical protein